MADSETDETPRKLELSPVQVAASALAAVSAAFFASVAGTAGTLIGAAAGSVIATVGAATYSYSLRRTSEIARRTAEQVREGALLSASLPRPLRPGETRRMPVASDGPAEGSGSTSVDPDPDSASGTAADLSSGTETDEVVTGWRRFDPRRADLPWGKVALASAAVLLITMVVITSFEGLTGRSVADVTRGTDSGSTTVGNLVRTDSDSPDAPGPRPEEDGGPVDAPDPGQTGQPTPAPTEQPPADPEPTLEPQPTAPAPSPTAPAPTAPAPTAPAPTGDSQDELAPGQGPAEGGARDGA